MHYRQCGPYRKNPNSWIESKWLNSIYITFSATPPLEDPDAMFPSQSTQITPTVSIMQSSSSVLSTDDCSLTWLSFEQSYALTSAGEQYATQSSHLTNRRKWKFIYMLHNKWMESTDKNGSIKYHYSRLFNTCQYSCKIRDRRRNKG